MDWEKAVYKLPNNALAISSFLKLHGGIPRNVYTHPKEGHWRGRGFLKPEFLFIK